METIEIWNLKEIYEFKLYFQKAKRKILQKCVKIYSNACLWYLGDIWVLRKGMEIL